jgi:hypothetical protein
MPGIAVGRPGSERLHRAILKTAFKLVVELGFRAVSIELIGSDSALEVCLESPPFRATHEPFPANANPSASAGPRQEWFRFACPCDAHTFLTKYCTSRGMSSRRSRKGGMRIWKNSEPVVEVAPELVLGHHSL